MKILKQIIKKIFISINKSEVIRKFLTRNYKSKKIGLGEKRSYAVVPHNWTMLDLEDSDINIDLTMTDLPFELESKEIIYSSHFFEHIQHTDAIKIIKNCYKLLKPGGVLKIEVPDFEKAIKMYINRDHERLIKLKPIDINDNYEENYHNFVGGIAACYIESGYHRLPKFDKTQFDWYLENSSIDESGDWCISHLSKEQKMTYGHQNIFYYRKLEKILQDVGFKEVIQCDNNENSVVNLFIPFKRKGREFFSIDVEAIK